MQVLFEKEMMSIIKRRITNCNAF
ncbi:hypothetical protein ACQ27_gp433 [Klebsiella phage K64-1]|nr:hypothetical protein ACQ27_gp433 [Klebsiella phage K64-1]